jgi:hypothetical protein
MAVPLGVASTPAPAAAKRKFSQLCPTVCDMQTFSSEDSLEAKSLLLSQHAACEGNMCNMHCARRLLPQAQNADWTSCGLMSTLCNVQQ